MPKSKRSRWDGQFFSNYIYSKYSYNCHFVLIWKENPLKNFYFFSLTRTVFLMKIPKINPIRILCDFLIDFIISLVTFS